jgi:hypothetical protein
MGEISGNRNTGSIYNNGPQNAELKGLSSSGDVYDTLIIK